ncbi:contractile injection system protein, VgrG/Pvc8 family [Rahnella bruchi]|nr:contractile injection system protein, VgrG/Pvc8 family [Rahnella bruchi]
MLYQHAAYEIFDYPGRFKDEQHGEDFARYLIEGWRNNADMVTGSSNSPRLQPGLCFALTVHPLEDLNSQWQVIACEMQGDQPRLISGRR